MSLERVAEVPLRICASGPIRSGGRRHVEQADPLPMVVLLGYGEKRVYLRYNLPYWKKRYGNNWAIDMCIEWFEYDGRRRNFQMDLTKDTPCPCKLAQAMLDIGRYMPIMDCDKDGDTSCPYNKGAQHCIQSTQPRYNRD